MPGAICFAWVGQGIDKAIEDTQAAGRQLTLSELVTPQITIALLALTLVAVLATIVRKVWGLQAALTSSPLCRDDVRLRVRAYMAKVLTPDICVIGAGPGGLAVATGAAAYGVRVVLVDKGRLGGQPGRRLTSTAGPCLPRLAATARQAEAVRTAGRFGLEAAEPEIDFKAVMANVREVASAAAPAVSPERLATLGVTVINAEARFTGRRRLIAGDTEIRARRYVIATGSSPVVPAIPGIAEIGCLDRRDTVFDLGRRPWASRHHRRQPDGAGAGAGVPAPRRAGNSDRRSERAAGRGPRNGVGRRPQAARRRRDPARRRQGDRRSSGAARPASSVLIETADGNDDVDGSHLLVAAGRAPRYRGP